MAARIDPSATNRQKKVDVGAPIRRRSRWLRSNLAIGAVITLALFAFASVFAYKIAPYPPDLAVGPPLALPSAKFLLGTDQLGRDILSRIIYGGRTAFEIGIASTLTASIVGIPIGLLSGYYEGRIDTILMRLMDAMLAFPSLILALAVVAVLGPGLVDVAAAVAIVSVPVYARLVRASTLQSKTATYVEAGRALGASDLRIMARYIMPDAISSLSVQITLSIAFAILTEASLSFLGLGIVPPTPDWGRMLNVGREFLLQAPLYSISPGAAIFLVVLSFNILGDALRDLSDPHKGSRSKASKEIVG